MNKGKDVIIATILSALAVLCVSICVNIYLEIKQTDALINSSFIELNKMNKDLEFYKSYYE